MQFSLQGTKTVPEPPKPWHTQQGNGAAEVRNCSGQAVFFMPGHSQASGHWVD